MSQPSHNSKGSKQRFKMNRCENCGNELKPWEGQKPFDDISGSRSQSHNSRVSRGDRRSRLTKPRRRSSGDDGVRSEKSSSRLNKDSPTRLSSSIVNQSTQISKKSLGYLNNKLNDNHIRIPSRDIHPPHQLKNNNERRRTFEENQTYNFFLSPKQEKAFHPPINES